MVWVVELTEYIVSEDNTYYSAISHARPVAVVAYYSKYIHYVFIGKSALVSHSKGMFTSYTASPSHTDVDQQSDLIAFLSIVQKYNVDILDITWQPTLNIGQGGPGTISQCTLITDIPLAFKRYFISGVSDSSDSDSSLLPLISEVLILSRRPVKRHPNVINLVGICWEIKPRVEKAVPVLVFAKAVWDLQQFINVSEAKNMSINGRLKICATLEVPL
jgi:hypothetical protein